MNKISKNELESSLSDISFIANHTELEEQMRKLLSLTQIYGSAVKEVTTKLEILNDQFKIQYAHNPIRYIESRVKSPEASLRNASERVSRLHPMTSRTEYLILREYV